VTASKSFTLTITPCVVTSLKVVQLSDLGDLAAKAYSLSSVSILNYPLTTKQTPACGYASSGWIASAVGPVPANFALIRISSGVYSVGPTALTNQRGTYTITITNVVVDGVTYDGSTYVLDSPSSFILDVGSPCDSTIVTASTVSNISLKVWDAEALYPLTVAAFTDFVDTVSTLNNYPTMCSKTYTASVTNNAGGNSLTTFSLDVGLSKFKIYSDA